MISGKKCFSLLRSVKMMIVIFFVLFLQLTGLLNAQVTHSQELNLTTSSDAELKASFSHEIAVPFLNSQNVLFASNEIDFEFSAFLSPISIGLGFETVFRPIAFLEFSAGSEAGTGWNSRFVRGLALNKPSGYFENDFINKSLKGIVHKEKVGAAFQFDLGAVIPGEWSHVVFRSYHEYYYKAFSAASESESWLWEADDGENRRP